ncbi:hypothetical protein NOVOSPHI9U_260003 [Novosphingobium sp. 9U]|nr:hypothetical protein NOVOSPHI9U_260003 [Novosphingobium sp. 9U]
MFGFSRRVPGGTCYLSSGNEHSPLMFDSRTMTKQI